MLLSYENFHVDFFNSPFMVVRWDGWPGRLTALPHKRQAKGRQIRVIFHLVGSGGSSVLALQASISSCSPDRSGLAMNVVAK